MKVMKKVLSALLTVPCFLMAATPTSAIAEEIERYDSTVIDFFTDETSEHGTGALEVSEQERLDFYASFPSTDDTDDLGTRSNTSLPSSIDLSTSSYFPSIGNQGSYNSCVSWATTYYQFTYEAHKLNDIITTDTNAYSPRWTFNFTNHGCNTGTNYTYAYNVFRCQGAVTMSEAPYSTSNYNYAWINNETAMLNALQTKLTNVSEVTLNTTNNQITSNTDTDLNGLKQALNNEKVLEIEVLCIGSLSNWTYKKTTSNEWVACRAYTLNNTNTGGHALTIVGYDDNVQCDVNGNGIIEASEKGAFKLANSWGTGWSKGNNGYIWVMYDALNKTSANTTNNWEASLPGTRIAIFTRDGGSINRARYINVANQTVNLAAVVNFNTDDCHNIGFYTNRCTGAYTSSNQNLARPIAYNFAGNNEVLRSYSGPFVLDFGLLDDNILNYLSGYRWYTKLNNQSNTKSATCVSYKIVDDKDVTVKNGTVSNLTINAGASNQFYANLNLQLGDVNYSETLTSDDSEMLMSIIVGLIEPSSLQKVLGDLEPDGRIDILDVITLNQLLLANNAISENEINDMYIQYQEYFIDNGIETAEKFYKYCSSTESYAQ